MNSVRQSPTTNLDSSIQVSAIVDLFENPKADVFLRSSDGTDLLMFSTLLSFASPFFEAMFDLPQSQSPTNHNEMRDGLPVVQMAESSSSLRLLLRFCHPGHAADLNNLEEIGQVLEPAIKYDMSGVARRVRSMLKAYTFEEPMRVFCIAWHFKLEEETRGAARRLLSLPLFPRPYFPELEHVPAAALHFFEEYHYKCARAASAVSKNFLWIDRKLLVQFDPILLACWDCTQGATVAIKGKEKLSSRSWWLLYMSDASGALLERPCGATVKGRDIMNRVLRKASDCVLCRDRVFVEMAEFGDLFAAEVERTIAAVSPGLYIPTTHV